MKKLLLALVLATPFFANTAEAAPLFYSRGEKVIKVADLPDVDITLPNGKKPAIGYCYKQLKILMIPVWNWDEKYCGYVDEKSYIPLEEEEFQAMVTLSTLMGKDTSWNDGKSKIPAWERAGGKALFATLLLTFIFYNWLKRREN